MTHHEQYILKVTAGATYDTSLHEDVHVNTSTPIKISSEYLDAQIHVRVKDYRGLPESSPSTSPYFSHPKHPYDRYSISFSFTPKTAISGNALVFGNDFEHPIRDRLPPLFDKAFGIVKWWIDPGLDGDVYGDKPYLYGPLLSSINVLRIGEKKGDGSSTSTSASTSNNDSQEVVVHEEGADGDGNDIRKDLGIPAAGSQRQSFFLNAANRNKFEFEQGREYSCDFFNPYLDFNEFALKIGYGLPAISIIGHWDGQPLRTHSLRYVLKNRETGKELFVVIFQLVPTEQAKKEAGVEDADEVFEEVHGKAEATTTTGGKNDDDLD